MHRTARATSRLLPKLLCTLGLLSGQVAASTDSAAGLPSAAGAEADADTANAFLNRYCQRCHNEERFAGYWALVDVAVQDLDTGTNLAAWEKIFRHTREGTMPPPARKKQPSAQERADFAQWLQARLDGYDAAHPDPGEASLRRLNRAEYANAVRDLLGIDLNLRDQLPPDDSGYGFDNIADVLTVSTTLMDRYFAVAGRLSRLAMGAAPAAPVLTSHQVPKDGSILNQGVPAYPWRASQRLPIDSRGGDAFDYFAPHPGIYEIRGYLNANTNNEVDRLEENRYGTRVFLNAGPHLIGMSFRRQLALDESIQTLRNNTDIVPLPEGDPDSLTLDFVVDGARVAETTVPAFHRSPRFAQKNFPRDILQIDIEGPFPAAADSQARAAAGPDLLRCRPGRTPSAERRCARKTLKPLARLAYRRAPTRAEMGQLLELFANARQSEPFRGAMATALQALLVSPSFLFVTETDTRGPATGGNQRISDTEFATRLALFLWSSIPDPPLLDLAQRRQLRQPRVLRQQIARMLADPKAAALTENFAGQWLFLRNLDHHRADVQAFPEFDVPLRRAMREETERFFAALVRDNGSALDFLNADYSFLNERLAAHYGIDGVQGTAFRRVALPADAHRGGLLGQASVLTLTSYGNHTSVVRRGQWVLDALLAAPPPPPPPDVPALVAEQAGRALTAREQLEAHRADAACASCHVRMDPLGLALEQYDAIGAFRTQDAGQLIDASAAMPDGTTFAGLPGIAQVLMARKDQFARALTEQFMTYALGRGLTARDRPTVRAVAAAAAQDGYRLHSLFLGIVNSYAFNHRRSTAP